MKEGNHPKFLRNLDESKAGVALIARWFQWGEYKVRIPSSTRAASHAEWRRHADNGDLFTTGHGLVNARFEGKHLGYNFTGRHDWPFSPHFIVCARHAWDFAERKPYAFISLSKDTRNAAVVFGRDHDLWYVESRGDHRYQNFEQKRYFAPMHTVTFFSMGLPPDPWMWCPQGAQLELALGFWEGQCRCR